MFSLLTHRGFVPFSRGLFANLLFETPQFLTYFNVFFGPTFLFAVAKFGISTLNAHRNILYKIILWIMFYVMPRMNFTRLQFQRDRIQSNIEVLILLFCDERSHCKQHLVSCPCSFFFAFKGGRTSIPFYFFNLHFYIYFFKYP